MLSRTTPARTDTCSRSSAHAQLLFPKVLLKSLIELNLVIWRLSTGQLTSKNQKCDQPETLCFWNDFVFNEFFDGRQEIKSVSDEIWRSLSSFEQCIMTKVGAKKILFDAWTHAQQQGNMPLNSRVLSGGRMRKILSIIIKNIFLTLMICH